MTKEYAPWPTMPDPSEIYRELGIPTQQQREQILLWKKLRISKNSEQPTYVTRLSHTSLAENHTKTNA